MSRVAAGVLLDPTRGHLTILGADGPALVTMVDTGGRLEMWAHEGATLSPEVAWLLSDALETWATETKARKRGAA